MGCSRAPSGLFCATKPMTRDRLVDRFRRDRDRRASRRYTKLPCSRRDCRSASGWGDLNSRPLDPQSSALTKLRHSPFLLRATFWPVSCYPIRSVSSKSKFIALLAQSGGSRSILRQRIRPHGNVSTSVLLRRMKRGASSIVRGSHLLVGVPKQPQTMTGPWPRSRTPRHVVIFPQFNAKSQSVDLKCVGGGTVHNAVTAFDAYPAWDAARIGGGNQARSVPEVGTTGLWLPAA
jgi:hypothetical protein